MPYEIRFRGQAQHFYDNDSFTVHPHARHVCDAVIVPWLETGPSAGGPDPDADFWDIQRYITAWDRMNAAPFGMDDDQYQDQREAFNAMRSNGTWKLVTIPRRMIAPTGVLYLTFGFDRLSQAPGNFDEVAGEARDLWCDFLTATFRRDA